MSQDPRLTSRRNALKCMAFGSAGTLFALQGTATTLPGGVDAISCAAAGECAAGGQSQKGGGGKPTCDGDLLDDTSHTARRQPSFTARLT